MEPALPPLTDAHVHLQAEEFVPDRPQVLERALTAGVSRLWCNGTCEADWDEVAQLAAAHPAHVVPWFGLHPWYLADRSAGWLERLEERLRAHPGAGLGECGLDRYRDDRDERAQEEVFRAQLALARRLDRAVTVHCLKAWGWLQEVLSAEPVLPTGVLIHAYGGPADLVRPLLERGCWFSFAGGTLAGKRRRAHEALRAVPRERLLVETDAPDIPPPEPHRPFGQPGAGGRIRNEPANLPAIVRGLAALRGEDPAELAAATAANAARLLAPR